jgi:hypothetical protein
VLRNTIMLMVLAIAGGALGGFMQSAASRAVLAEADSPKVIRATGFELVDNDGKRIGYLGADGRRNAILVFFDSQGTKRAEFGLVYADSPGLGIFSPKGESLLSIGLGQRAKPRLIMSEDDFTGRVYLGVAEPDAPDPEWKYDTWVLRFQGDRRPLAMVGMATPSAGGLAVFDEAGRQWRTPLR